MHTPMSRFDHLFSDRQPIPTDEVEDLLIAARALPKISVDDPRVTRFLQTGERQYTRQFGNNFYLLWISLKNPDPNSAIWKIYGGRAVANPGWETFVAANEDAVLRVNRVIEELYEPADAISSKLLDYINNGQFDVYQRFRDELDHPLGFSAAEHYVWDNMNVALMELSGRMGSSGIDPNQFYG